jgi:hypothetical protein
VILGFGDASVAAVVRPGAGALLWHDGVTRRAGDPRIEALGGEAGWRATDGNGLDVVLEPLGGPASFADGTREWLCRVRGTAAGVAVECLGHAVAEAAPGRGWKRPGLGREVAAWLGDDLAVALRARRPSRAKNHEAEEVSGFVWRGDPVGPHPIDDPRLSTAYAGDGVQRRAGLELWETEESEFPLRLAGETVGEGELELAGGLRLRCAFLRWHHGGRVGAGRYDIVRAGA